jgi:hypothetical protein
MTTQTPPTAPPEASRAAGFGDTLGDLPFLYP